METHENEPTAEPVARGLVRAWFAAKLAPWIVRLSAWAMWLGGIAAYAGYVAWRVRRMVRAGALDGVGETGPEALGGGSGDAMPPPSVTARERGVFAWVRDVSR